MVVFPCNFFFIRFVDVSPPNKNSQTNGFSQKFPLFFLCKKTQIESDGWTSLVGDVLELTQWAH